MAHFKEPRSPVRQRTRALRTEEILATARELVVAGGVEALTLHRVAKALSYVPAALYRYFPSKEALVAALIGQALDELGDSLHTAADAVPGGRSHPLARVLSLVEGFLTWTERAPHQATMVALALADPRVLVPQQELARSVASHAVPALWPVVEALQDATDAGLLDKRRPAPVQALLLVGGVVGIGSMQKMVRLAPDALDIPHLAREQARVLLRGLGATPAQLAEAEAHIRPGNAGA